jgi:hypothetical protein
VLVLVQAPESVSDETGSPLKEQGAVAMSKIVVLVAGAAGYVLGARAGQERYEQIKAQFGRVRNDPTVQKAASNAQDVVAEKAPAIKDKTSGAADKAKGGAAEPEAGEGPDTEPRHKTPSGG